MKLVVRSHTCKVRFYATKTISCYYSKVFKSSVQFISFDIFITEQCLGTADQRSASLFLLNQCFEINPIKNSVDLRK